MARTEYGSEGESGGEKRRDGMGLDGVGTVVQGESQGGFLTPGELATSAGHAGNKLWGEQ